MVWAGVIVAAANALANSDSWLKRFACVRFRSQERERIQTDGVLASKHSDDTLDVEYEWHE